MERCVDRSLEGGEKIYYGSVTRPVEKRISNNFPPFDPAAANVRVFSRFRAIRIRRESFFRQ